MDYPPLFYNDGQGVRLNTLSKAMIPESIPASGVLGYRRQGTNAKLSLECGGRNDFKRHANEGPDREVIGIGAVPEIQAAIKSLVIALQQIDQ